jgi:hypothetical protein
MVARIAMNKTTESDGGREMKNSKKETQMSDITITGYCAKCHQWATPDFLATLRLSAHAGGDVCLNCLADKSWGYLKRHVCSADYLKVARYKQFTELTGTKGDKDE